MTTLGRKRRTREHVIADLSVNHVERFALQCGYVLQRVTHDYGIDLQLITFNRKGEFEEGYIAMQLKASKRLEEDVAGQTVSCRIQRRDLISWLAQPMPVMLIAYDAQAERAYWVYVQSHFRQQKGFNIFVAGATITVHFPRANLVNKAAIRKFARFRDNLLAQMRNLVHEEN